MFEKICIADEIREANELRPAETAFVIAKPELVNPFESFQRSHLTDFHGQLRR